MRRLIILSLVFSALFAGLGFAAGTGGTLPSVFQMSIEELCNVEVISSSKRAQSQLESPAVIQVLTSEDIAMLDFNTLEECLEYVTGLSSINGEGNIFTTTTIRGNTLVNYNTNTLLLFDSIPIYSPYHGSFDFSFIPLAAIDRVEIVKGANSVLYGSNAINAVINVISKRAAAADKPVQLQAATRYGSYRTSHSQGSLLTRKSDLEIDLFGDFNDSDGEHLQIKDEAGHQLKYRKDLRTHSLVARISCKDLTLHLQDYRRQLDNYRTRDFSFAQANDEKARLFNLDLNHIFNEKYSLHLRAGYYDWKLTKRFSPEFAAPQPDYDWDYEGDLWSGEIEFSFSPVPGWQNIVGTGASRAKARRYKDDVGDYDVGKDDEPVYDGALYLNGSYRFIPELELVYGGRYYYSSYHCDSTDDDITDHNFSTRFGLVYQVRDDVYLKLLYGESFRIPTFFEKQVASKTVIGNPWLNPEKSVSYDLVLSSLFSWGRLDLDFYQMKIKDKITRVPVADGKLQNRNVGTYKFRGVELNSRFHYGNFQGFAGYAYCYGEDDETGDELDFTYNHMASLAGSYRVNEKLELRLSSKYLSDWGAAEDYIVVNSGFSYRPRPGSGWELSAKVDNLFGTNIELPEIARQNEAVKTIPKTSEPYYYVGVSYSY